jgi:hypothetical protein
MTTATGTECSARLHRRAADAMFVRRGVRRCGRAGTGLEGLVEAVVAVLVPIQVLKPRRPRLRRRATAVAAVVVAAAAADRPTANPFEDFVPSPRSFATKGGPAYSAIESHLRIACSDLSNLGRFTVYPEEIYPQLT